MSYEFKSAISNIENFESDAIDYLYDVEPQSQNLFYVCNFHEKSGSKEFYNASFRARSVDLPGVTLGTKTDVLTHLPVFDTAEYERIVTINWFEDVYHSVQKYHEDWVASWYNFKYETLRCGPSGKFRSIDLIAYHFVNSNTKDAVLETPDVEPLFAYRIAGMVPNSLPQVKFDYGAEQNDSPYTITYRCSKIECINNANLKIWDPKIALASGINNGEKLRIKKLFTN
jgi:hypothetical protein